MKTKRYLEKLFVLLAIFALLLSSLACGVSPNTVPRPAPDGNQGQVQSTATPKPINTPRPTIAPTIVTVGLSRSNPYPRTEVVSAPNWDVQILEVIRGDVAWQDIRAANMFNDPAPEGMEYILVRIHVKSTYTDDDEHTISSCDFDITGDRLTLYTCRMAGVVEPEPRLDASLYPRGEAEGWAAFLVGQGEGNLMLVVNEIFNFDTDAKRYIAIDDGASINVPPELANISPTDAGEDRNAPAARTETIITEDWEISILDVVRGADAWTMVLQENQYNDPPADGYEYIAVKVNTRYIGTTDRAGNINGFSFKSTGSAGVLYDTPSVVVPSPRLDIDLYPGGEYEGWVVVQAAQGETNMSLVYEPWLDFSSQNKRFISLEP